MTKHPTDGRLLSLDALRGFDMFFIMGGAGLIAALCALWPCGWTDALAETMKHPAWDGFSHHDTIFPLFLFIAGVTFPLSLAKQQAAGTPARTIRLRILRRGALLVLLGMVYNGLFKLDFATLRCASVLGRIGIAWAVAALLYMQLPRRALAILSFIILTGYALLSAFVAAPDAPAGADPLSLEGCLAGYIDRRWLPGTLIYKTFDPEGWLSTLPAVVTALIGMETGRFIRRTDIAPARKAAWIAAAGAAFLVAGLALSYAIPINKKLWSSSFVCVVAAYSLGMFALFYYLIDVRGWQQWTLFFRVIGVNSITIYLGQRIIGFSRISEFFLGGLQSLVPAGWSAVIASAGYIAACWLFLWFLYRKQTFLKV